MKQILVNEEQVRSIYEEVERHLQLEIDDEIKAGVAVTPAMIHNLRADYLQGVYSALMALSINWPDVVSMICHQEEEMHWRDLGYPED